MCFLYSGGDSDSDGMYDYDYEHPRNGPNNMFEGVSGFQQQSGWIVLAATAEMLTVKSFLSFLFLRSSALSAEIHLRDRI